jgi:RecB family exonuclease
MSQYSYSDLNSYLRCPRQYWYRAIQKIQRVRKDATLHQGTAIHALLMSGFLAMQRGDSVLPAVSEQWVELDEAVLDDFSAFPAEAEPVRDMLAESYSIVQRYFEQVDWTGWTVLHVEEEFTVTVDGRIITFTPDLVMEDPHGKVWVVDHKSTNSIPEELPFANQQSLLYFAGVQAHYPNAVGFLFNYLRKKLPTEPRLNKTKDRDTGMYFVNDLNRIDTEFDMLFRFITDEAPELFSDERHKRRLAELRDNPNRFFKTKRVLANEAALNQIVDEAVMVIDKIETDEVYNTWVRVLQDDGGYMSCGKCEFNAICAAELLDFNVEVVLREYEPRDPKNPYETEDE